VRGVARLEGGPREALSPSVRQQRCHLNRLGNIFLSGYLANCGEIHQGVATGIRENPHRACQKGEPIAACRRAVRGARGGKNAAGREDFPSLTDANPVRRPFADGAPRRPCVGLASRAATVGRGTGRRRRAKEAATNGAAAGTRSSARARAEREPGRAGRCRRTGSPPCPIRPFVRRKRRDRGERDGTEGRSETVRTAVAAGFGRPRKLPARRRPSSPRRSAQLRRAGGA
jgi:hypothetical protein